MTELCICLLYTSFKPITAAVGLESGAIDPMEDYWNVGLIWQKDASWGSYYVTTLHTYEPVILENALIYSDNIDVYKRQRLNTAGWYFARSSSNP